MKSSDSANSSEVSPGNPTMTSVEIETSGIADLASANSLENLPWSVRLDILARVASQPLCSGMWR